MAGLCKSTCEGSGIRRSEGWRGDYCDIYREEAWVGVPSARSYSECFHWSKIHSASHCTRDDHSNSYHRPKAGALHLPPMDLRGGDSEMVGGNRGVRGMDDEGTPLFASPFSQGDDEGDCM
jgi:hypothetical protein